MANPDQTSTLSLTLPAFYYATLQQAQTLHDTYASISWFSRVSQSLMGGDYRWSPIVATLIAYLEEFTPPNNDAKNKPSDAFTHLSHEEVINLLNTIRHYSAKHLLMSAQSLDEAGPSYFSSSCLNEYELTFFKQVFAYAHLVHQVLRLPPMYPCEFTMETPSHLSTSSTTSPLSTSSSMTSPAMPVLPKTVDPLNTLCERVLLGPNFTENDYHQHFIQAVHNCHHDALLLLTALFPPTTASLAKLATMPFTSDKPFSQHSIEYINACSSDSTISSGMKSAARESLFMAWSSMIGTHTFIAWLGPMPRNRYSINSKLFPHQHSIVYRRMLLNARKCDNRALFNILVDVHEESSEHAKFLFNILSVDHDKSCWAFATIFEKFNRSIIMEGLMSTTTFPFNATWAYHHVDMTYQLIPYLSYRSRSCQLASIATGQPLKRGKDDKPLSPEQEAPYLALVFSILQEGISGRLAGSWGEGHAPPYDGVSIEHLIFWQLKSLRDHSANTSYRLAVLLLMLAVAQRRYLNHARVNLKQLSDDSYKNSIHSSMYSYINNYIREDVPYLPLISACLMSILTQMGNSPAVDSYLMSYSRCNAQLNPKEIANVVLWLERVAGMGHRPVNVTPISWLQSLPGMDRHIVDAYLAPHLRYYSYQTARLYGKDDPILISLLTYLSAYLQNSELSDAERGVISEALNLINRAKDVTNLADMRALIAASTTDVHSAPINSSSSPSSSTVELSLSDPCSSTSFVIPAQPESIDSPDSLILTDRPWVDGENKRLDTRTAMSIAEEESIPGLSLSSLHRNRWLNNSCLYPQLAPIQVNNAWATPLLAITPTEDIPLNVLSNPGSATTSADPSLLDAPSQIPVSLKASENATSFFNSSNLTTDEDREATEHTTTPLISTAADPTIATTSSLFSSRSPERTNTVSQSTPITPLTSDGLTLEEQAVRDALPSCPKAPLPLPTAQSNEQRNPEPVFLGP